MTCTVDRDSADSKLRSCEVAASRRSTPTVVNEDALRAEFAGRLPSCDWRVVDDTSPFAGKVMKLTNDGRWDAEFHSSLDSVKLLESLRAEALELESDSCTATLERTFATVVHLSEDLSECLRWTASGVSDRLILKFREIDPTACYCVRAVVPVSPDALKQVAFTTWVETGCGRRARCSFSNRIRSQTNEEYELTCTALAGEPWLLVLDAADIRGERLEASIVELRRTLDLLGLLVGFRVDSIPMVTIYDSVGSVRRELFDNGSVRIASFPLIPALTSHISHFRRTRPHVYAETELANPTLSDVFSAFVQEPRFSITVQYLLMFGELPLHVRGAAAAVALESITTYLSKRDECVVPQLVSVPEWEKLRRALSTVVRDASLDSEVEKTLVAKLSSLNQPSNKSKLLATFDRHGVSLPTHMIAAVEQRNRWLHVGAITLPGERGAESHWERTVLVEQALYSAVGLLLLKALGYAGIVIDWGVRPTGGVCEYIDIT